MTARNLWVQTDDTFATWVADLSPLREQPERLLEFVLGVLQEGARHRVLEVLEAPLIGYGREHHGALCPLLSRLYQEQHVVEAFGFTGAAMAPGHPQSSTVQAALAWYDARGQIQHGDSTDLGALLARFEPAPDAFPLNCLRHYPPLQVKGSRLEYGASAGAPKNYPSDWPIEVRFSLHSDIWFPWVHGLAHPESDYERMFDNHELAGLHTPRLNAFLQAVGAKADKLGGSWRLDPEGMGLGMSPWITREGIDLTARPGAYMPPETLDQEWP